MRKFTAAIAIIPRMIAARSVFPGNIFNILYKTLSVLWTSEAYLTQEDFTVNVEIVGNGNQSEPGT
jgi:hypothetical protein